MKQHLTIQVVTWNSAGVIVDLLDSIRRQPYKEYDLFVVDNASTDGTVALVRANAPNAAIVQNEKNVGFSRAHNQGFSATDSEYILLVNPDVQLLENSLLPLVERMKADRQIGSVGAKLLKTAPPSGIIDSAGITAKRFRQFLDRGQGEADRGQYDIAGEVFGISGAFVLLRRSALESVRIGNEILDEDFFAYKEDIDLAWRLRRAGWKNWYEPAACAVHARAVKHAHVPQLGIRGRRSPGTIRRLSYRNHLLLLIKNDRVRDWFLPLPRVIVYEALKFVFALFREPKTLLGLPQAIRLLPQMLRKRAIIHARSRVSPPEQRRWFS